MKYRLSNPTEAGQALQYLSQLTADQKMVEIKEVKPRRSLPQNSYLHLLLGAFGSHFGMDMEQAKGAYKRLPGNKDIYIKRFEQGGAKFEYERSSASLDKEEMTKTIETLREWSAKMGYPLPTATDQDWLRQIDNEIERNSRYL